MAIPWLGATVLRKTGPFLVILIGAAAVAATVGCSRGSESGPGGAPTSGASGPATPSSGGRITVTYRSEPKTFNRLVSPQQAEEMVARLTQATLLRVDRTTGKLEPRLAREWTSSPDGLTWTLK